MELSFVKRYTDIGNFTSDENMQASKQNSHHSTHNPPQIFK